MALSACATAPIPPRDLISGLAAHCGKAYAGRITSDPNPRDADFAGKDLIMHVRVCRADQAQVPFHVGDDRSRTWVITRLADGALRLKHDHRHADGTEDKLTQYGGDTVGAPQGLMAAFPVDSFSKEMFVREGLSVSLENVWIMQLTDTAFVYTLTRPGRRFEVTFDLTTPVLPPPTPWGY